MTGQLKQIKRAQPWQKNEMAIIASEWQSDYAGLDEGEVDEYYLKSNRYGYWLGLKVNGTDYGSIHTFGACSCCKAVILCDGITEDLERVECPECKAILENKV